VSTVGLVQIESGWWEFEGDEPPGVIFCRPDQGGDPDSVRAILRVVATDDDKLGAGDPA
jgi:hypothetical protein